MKELFEGIKILLKLEEVSIDNVVFRLHYKATVLLLIVFSLVVTSKEYIGDPIACHTRGEKSNVIDTYCWIFSTYTVLEKAQEQDPIAKNTLLEHPGVGPVPHDPSSPGYKKMIKHHKYYQWVGFVLLLQALLFYIPYYLWKLWEGGRLRGLVLEVSQPVLETFNEGENENHRGVLSVIKFILRYWELQLHYHNGYAFQYVLCELLNMVNVILQFYLLDSLLGGDFMSYGTTLFDSNSEVDSSHIIERIFPKVAKCSFERFGPTGSKVTIDALCVLSLNVVNEKIFLVLWFWFIILSFLSGATILYRIACCGSRTLRVSLIRSRARSISSCRVRALLRVLDYGDWFLLHQMSKNMNSLAFSKLICEMSDKFGRHNRDNHV